MFATYSPEAQIERIMAARKLSRQFVSNLATHAGIRRCSLPTLCAALDGRGFQNETGQALLELLREVDAFTDLFSPVEVKLENASSVYGWLQLVRAGRLRVFALNEQDELVERGGKL